MLWVDFLPIMFFIVKRHLLQKHLHIFLFVSFSFFTQLICYVLIKFGFQTILIAYIYNFLATIIILHFLYSKFRISKAILFIFYVYSGISLFLFLDNLNFYYFIILSNLMITITSLAASILIIKHNYNQDKLTIFFIFSIFIYYTVSLSLFYIIPFLNDNNIELWSIHNIIEMISKLIITYSIWKLPSKSIS